MSPKQTTSSNASPSTQQQPSPQNANPDAEVAKIWGALSELLEQLSSNRQASIQLHSLAAGVKVCRMILYQGRC